MLEQKEIDQKYIDSKRGATNGGYGEIARMKRSVFLAIKALEALELEIDLINTGVQKKDLWLYLLQLRNTQGKLAKEAQRSAIRKVYQAKFVYLSRYCRYIYKYKQQISRDVKSYLFFLQIEKILILEKCLKKLALKSISSKEEEKEIIRLSSLMRKRIEASHLVLGIMLKTNCGLPAFVKLAAKSRDVVSEDFYAFVHENFGRYLPHHVLKVNKPSSPIKAKKTKIGFFGRIKNALKSFFSFFTFSWMRKKKTQQEKEESKPLFNDSSDEEKRRVSESESSSESEREETHQRTSDFFKKEKRSQNEEFGYAPRFRVF